MYAYTTEPNISRSSTALILAPAVNLFQLSSLSDKAAVRKFYELFQNVPDLIDLSINTKSHLGCTCLHNACLRNQPLLVVCLLEAGADPNITSTGDGCNAAHFAARCGNICILRLIFTYGGRLNQPNDQGWFPLHVAADAGHIHAMVWLLDVANVSRLDAVDKLGRTLFHLVCTNGSRIGLECLLDSLSHSNNYSMHPLLIQDYSGNTCLHAALYANTTTPSSSYQTKNALSHGNVGRKVTWSLIADPLSRNVLTSTKNYVGDRAEDVLAVNSPHDWVLRGLIRYARFSYQLRLLSFCLHFLFVPFILCFTLLLQSTLRSSLPIYIGFVILGVTFMQQPHRTCDAMEQVNPTPLSIFTSGAFYGTACYYVYILPIMQPFWLFGIFPYVLFPVWVGLFLWLVYSDPGELKKQTGGFRETFREFIDTSSAQFRNDVLSMKNTDQFPEAVKCTDRYCVPCDILWPSNEVVKHCKLCQRCFVGFDHHCLFLSTCVAKQNVRFFIALVCLTCVMTWWFVFTTPFAVLTMFYEEVNDLANYPATYRIYRLSLCAVINQPQIVSVFLCSIGIGVWCLRFARDQIDRFYAQFSTTIIRDGFFRTYFKIGLE